MNENTGPTSLASLAIGVDGSAAVAYWMIYHDGFAFEEDVRFRNPGLSASVVRGESDCQARHHVGFLFALRAPVGWAFH